MSTIRMIFATGNQGKMDEIRAIMKDFLLKHDIELLSLKDLNDSVEIVEDADTFEANALIKATTIANLTDSIVLADDSGLEVDYLDKAPGVYSARFLGVDTSYNVKNRYILNELANVVGDERSARFVCAIACVFPNGKTLITRGTIEGLIANDIMGENGFGYDPIFYVPEYGCTSAELPPEKKNEISHRGVALTKMMTELDKHLITE